MIDEIERIVADAVGRVRAAATLDDLKALEVEVLGKQAPLSAVKKQLGGLDADERRTVGHAVNAATAAIGDAIGPRRADARAGGACRCSWRPSGST